MTEKKDKAMSAEEYIKSVSKQRGDNLVISKQEAARHLELFAKQKMLDEWVEYDFNVLESRPPEYGKYFVHRKDGKVHWETWNGSGWAYNEKVITHWRKVLPPASKQSNQG